jgi:hypothetical protein
MSRSINNRHSLKELKNENIENMINEEGKEDMKILIYN